MFFYLIGAKESISDIYRMQIFDSSENKAFQLKRFVVSSRLRTSNFASFPFIAQLNPFAFFSPCIFECFAAAAVFEMKNEYILVDAYDIT